MLNRSAMTCVKCKYWDAIEMPLEDGEESSDLVPDEGYGECKRYPPVLRRPLRDEEDAAKTSAIYRTVLFWTRPVATGDDWCGEFKPHEAYEC